MNDSLIIIPARGGSKGLPRKNIRPLAGKPLLYYTIDAARGITTDDHICLSSDDQEIIRVAENYGLFVPFVRPSELASDNAGIAEVLLHALHFYESILDRSYDKIILLQPTSPFRHAAHIAEALALWQDHFDMVVSVNESHANPYFNLFEEDENGFLKKSKTSGYVRRQDAPIVWQFNGAIYIISNRALKERRSLTFNYIVKYPMDALHSIDIDDPTDLHYAEFIINNNLI